MRSLNIKRLPSVLYRYRKHIYVLSGLCLCVVYILFQKAVICTNLTPWRHVKNICTDFESGEALGNLCGALCTSGNTPSLTCKPSGTIFVAEIHDTKLVFKKANYEEFNKHDPVYWIDPKTKQLNYPSETEFKNMIRRKVERGLNLTIANSNINRLSRLKPWYEEKERGKRKMEMDNIWKLLHINEFLCLTVYIDYDVFPQLIGTCGSYYVVEYLEPLEYGSIFAIRTEHTKEDWSKRVKTALMIIKLLEELETSFTEPMHLCDIKIDHFGVTKDQNRIKFLDLDMVHPKSIINQIIGQYACTQDDQCDYFDCTGRCDKVTGKCFPRVTNNNLQVVCKKIFLGWDPSQTIILPGLLVSEHTPAQLAAVLRQCSNPGSEITTAREPAPEDVRVTLYNILSEIDVNLENELL